MQRKLKVPKLNKKKIGKLYIYKQLDNKNEAKDTFNIEDILNIDKKKVRHTYRKLSLKHHPDKGGDTETMKQIKSMMGNTVLSHIRVMPDCHCSVGCVVSPVGQDRLISFTVAPIER